MENLPLITAAALALNLAILLGFAVAWNRASARGHVATVALEQSIARLHEDNERLERELRQALESSASTARMEATNRLGQLQTAFGAQLAQSTGAQTEQLGLYGRTMQEQLSAVSVATRQSLAEVRTTLEGRLQALQQGNEAKLDQMRATVEEKLQTTLETRLGESFRLVSERLEQVHQGLGEMQSLAAGVGDLKRVLGNVKVRGQSVFYNIFRWEVKKYHEFRKKVLRNLQKY